MDDGAAPARRMRNALRLHSTIARDLGIAIVAGRYRPGDVLTGEIASCAKLSVSRSAYREAMRILAAKGLVEAKPKVGTKVCPREAWQILDPDVLSWAFADQPGREFLLALFELRDIVEPAAAALAAVRRTAADLEAMQDAIERMTHFTMAMPEGLEADRDFHAALLHASANPFIETLTAGIGAAVRTTTAFKQRERPPPRNPVPDHVDVFEAIAAGDARGSDKAMRELIRQAMRDMGIRQPRTAAQPDFAPVI